jgi:cytochrome c-type biogenesis protein CcmH
MNAIFLASTFLMLLLAFSFSAMPLVRNARNSSHGFAKVPVFVVLAALLLAIGLYAAIGRPDVVGNGGIRDPSVAKKQRSTADAAQKAASVNELLAGLEMRLQEDPDNAKGWLLLARSYDHLGREHDAADAYQKATQLGLTDSELEARLR